MKVGVLGGGFKPPHKGHYDLAKQAFDHGIGELRIYIGPKARSGANITQDQALQIWQEYAKSLPGKVVLEKHPMPIRAAYTFARENPDHEVLWFLGQREGDEDDTKDIHSRTASLRKDREKPEEEQKYSNLDFQPIKGRVQVSGTAARQALQAGDKEAIMNMLPDETNKQEILDVIESPEVKMADAIDEVFANFIYEEQEEVEEVTKGSAIAPVAVLPSAMRQKLQNYTTYLRNLLPDVFDVEYRQDHIRVSVPYFDKEKNHKEDWTPHQRQLPEQAEGSKFDFTPHIASILEYCMSQDMKVVPIPEVKIRQDEENAANLFGRTGYYDPQNKEIVLYITGRHPKDVLRSFCHELVHHMQNLEGQNLTFYTTDVHADENLKAIEQEAHAKGSFLFRDWENSNKEQETLDEAAILESLSTSEKENLVRQVIRLTKVHGDNVEKIAARLELPSNLRNKISGVGKSFGVNFAKAVVDQQKKNIAEGTKYRSIVVDVRKAVNDALNTLIKGEKLGGYNLPVKREPTEEHRDLAEKYGFTPLGLMLNSEYQSAYLGTFKSKSEKGTPTEVGVSLKFALSDEVEKGKFYIDGEASSDEAELDIILAFNPEDGTNILQQIQPTLTDLIRHETEHLTQSGEQVKPDKWMRGDQARRQKIRQNPEIYYKYFLLPKEVDANLQGLYAKSKYDKASFQDTVDAYLTDLVGDEVITQANSKQIYNKWKTRAAEIGGIPELK